MSEEWKRCPRGNEGDECNMRMADGTCLLSGRPCAKVVEA